MSNLIHLQNILNKVIEESKSDALDAFSAFMIEKLEGIDKEQVDALKEEFKKTTNVAILSFGPKKKEKKSRPPNSYNMFIKHKMHEIKLANPSFKGKELMKRATQEWNKEKKAKEEALATASAEASTSADTTIETQS